MLLTNDFRKSLYAAAWSTNVNDSTSVIDETNLQTIAEELGIPYQHRTADAAIELPEAPTTTTNYAESGEVGNVIERKKGWIRTGVEAPRIRVLRGSS